MRRYYLKNESLTREKRIHFGGISDNVLLIGIGAAVAR